MNPAVLHNYGTNLYHLGENIYEAERKACMEKANQIKKAVDIAERRIRWIPLVFILLHFFDTIQILASFSVSSLEKVDSHGCTSDGIRMFVFFDHWSAGGILPAYWMCLYS